jgi:hypothetical protein
MASMGGINGQLLGSGKTHPTPWNRHLLPPVDMDEVRRVQSTVHAMDQVDGELTPCGFKMLGGR